MTQTLGNDKTEAVENARLGLEKMEREIRAAYPVKGPFSTGTDRYRFFNANGNSNVPPGDPPPALMPTDTQVTFGNERGTSIGSDGAIRCPSSASCEYITYKLTDRVGGSCDAGESCTLRRVNTAYSTDTGQPVVEFVKPGGLTFRYLDASGNLTTNQDNIARVGISLRISKDGRTQDLNTEVDLRNPGATP